MHLVSVGFDMTGVWPSVQSFPLRRKFTTPAQRGTPSSRHPLVEIKPERIFTDLNYLVIMNNP